MREITIFCCLILLSFSSNAQDPGIEYFAKAPSKYVKPGLSPMKFFQISYLNVPANEFVKHNAELRSDLFRIKVTPELSVIFSLGFYAGAKRQMQKLYQVNGRSAKEQMDYVSVAPIASASVSYGFFYPFFVRAGGGAYKPYEMLFYRTKIPQQISGSTENEIQTYTYKNSEIRNGAVKPYGYLEVYRPIRKNPNGKKRTGITVGGFYWPGNEAGNKFSLTGGFYWNI